MFVNTLSKMQQDLRFLTAAEREQLALAAWNSLGDGSDPAVSQQLDPGGIELALQRDGEVESGENNAITSEKFLQRTRR